MKISIITFTGRGTLLAERIKEALAGSGENEPGEFQKVQINIEERHKKANERQKSSGRDKACGQQSLTEWARGQFLEKNAIVVIGACGIAVRMIAPFVTDKLTDSPVVVVDEAENFVIPLLSGHMGGANELAEQIAAKIGAIPVLTTATDVNDTFSADLFAKRCHLAIENREGIAKVSAGILDGNMADIVISRDLTELEHGILRLKPKEYMLGVGCRRGKSFEEIRDFLERCLRQAGVEKELVRAVASIDLKKEEEGLLRWCAANRIPFFTYSARELCSVPGDFTGSSFVQRQTGVDNVCERAAMAAAEGRGTFVLKKQAENGMTAAIVHVDWKLEKELAKEYEIDEQ